MSTSKDQHQARINVHRDTRNSNFLFSLSQRVRREIKLKYFYTIKWEWTISGIHSVITSHLKVKSGNNIKTVLSRLRIRIRKRVEKLEEISMWRNSWLSPKIYKVTDKKCFAELGVKHADIEEANLYLIRGISQEDANKWILVVKAMQTV